MPIRHFFPIGTLAVSLFFALACASPGAAPASVNPDQSIGPARGDRGAVAVLNDLPERPETKASATLICTSGEPGTHESAIGGNELANAAGEKRVTAKAHQQAPVDFNHPPRDYVTYTQQGWEVLVERQLADEDPVTAKATLVRVEKKLGEIAALLPPATLPDLRKLKVFILYGTKAKAGGRDSGLEYFRTDAPTHHHWLDARMGRSIVIFNAANYLKLTEQWALKSLVHEFGHAQHLEHWPEDHPNIYDAWKAAVKAGRYQTVCEEDKDTHFPNYAAQNHLEYFAELTAMYFVGANYFPRDRAGLKAYDPAGYALIEKLWGVHAPLPVAARAGDNE